MYGSRSLVRQHNGPNPDPSPILSSHNLNSLASISANPNPSMTHLSIIFSLPFMPHVLI